MPSERVQRHIDRLLDQAEEASVSKDWDSVAQFARAVLEADPANEDALTIKRMAEAAGGVDSAESDSLLGNALAASEAGKATQPTSFSSGRYTVSKFLGEGGKKKVYLAHDNTLDRDVAFALIKTEGLDDTSRERVKREAQAMGRMGTHPCIMPIYDLGEEPDANGVAQPFMVQPLMGGGDVEGLIEDAEGPLALEDAIRIATQTAQGLVFAHGKGIVHRDLKPGNVWMDEDGAAKIGDFGLAVATDRSRLTVEKMMVGTVNYMPPEQATGGEVTPKADLYSLGAMLYEMSTGRVPFMGDDDIAVISQHVNTPPVAPSWHNSLIPKTLDSLILRMMAKDPAERPSDADEVLAALSSVDLSAVEESSEERKGSLDAMAGGVFVGRHKEMDQLKAGFEEVLSGKGRMVTLVGEPGIGKTRTAQELATYAAMRGAEVLWGRSYESGGAPPYWPWVQAIRSHVAATDPQVLRNQLGSTASVIAEIVSDVKEKLPDLSPATPIEDPESARFRLFDSISTFLKNTASATPVVLMLEDLHWSDKPSLMLLEFVARELANSRILIVGNYRDMELNRRHPLSVTLGDLSRERLFERVVLRGLQRHDVERFIEIAAGITPPTALVDTVHSQTEGNPLFVTETVRLLIQEGDITSGQSTTGGTTSWEIRIPEGVREVIGRRLDRLSERTNEVLTIAAVVGRQFRFPVLKMLMEDTTDGQLLDALDEALSARIIEELPVEVGLYQFTHAQMQETLTEELSLTRRVRLHARIAEALEQHYAGEIERHAEELVEHYEQAQTMLGTERLIQHAINAGNAAWDQFAFEDSHRFFLLAYGLMDGSESLETLAGVQYGRARVFFIEPSLSGQETWDLMVASFENYLAAELPKKALKAITYEVSISNDLTGVIEPLKKAVTVPVQGSIEHGWVRIRYGIALHTQLLDFEGAISTYQEVLELARQQSDALLEGRALVHLCQIEAFRNNFGSAIKYGTASRSLALETKDIATISRLWFFIASLLAVGSTAEALETFKSMAEVGGGRLQGRWHGQSLVNQFMLARATGVPIAEIEINTENLEEGFAERIRIWPLILSGDIEDPVGMVVPVIGQGSTIGTRLEVMRPNVVYELVSMLDDSVVADPRIAEHIPEARDIDDQKNKAFPWGATGNRNIAALYAWRRRDKRVAPDLLGVSLIGEKSPFDPVCQSSNLLATGLLKFLAGKAGVDEDLQQAMDTCKAAGAKSELLRTQVEYSELLLERDEPGDREKAAKLQDEAIDSAKYIGSKPLLERVLAKREILKA